MQPLTGAQLGASEGDTWEEVAEHSLPFRSGHQVFKEALSGARGGWRESCGGLEIILSKY